MIVGSQFIVTAQLKKTISPKFKQADQILVLERNRHKKSVCITRYPSQNSGSTRAVFLERWVNEKHLDIWQQLFIQEKYIRMFEKRYPRPILLYYHFALELGAPECPDWLPEPMNGSYGDEYRMADRRDISEDEYLRSLPETFIWRPES